MPLIRCNRLSMDKIELRRIGSLHLHPDNVAIFGLPTGEPNYEEIREDIKRKGLQEPLIILEDGTILSGHIRYASVCWVLEQDGLTQDEILEQVIAVRVHEDFESKEEELEYLMSANEKRRQLDPRRIASAYDKLVQVIEARLENKKGKKGEALQGLADRLGTSHKLAKNYYTIFSSKIVPDDVKDKINSKDLAPTAVLEAIKFAEDSAKRECRAPSITDVDAYIKHPKAKTSLADTVRQVAKVATVVTSTGAPTGTPKADPKPVTVEVAAEPPKVTKPEPVIEPEPVVNPVVEPQPIVEPEPLPARNVHTAHCCLDHGCKYNDPECPVANGKQKQESSCEICGLIAEGYYSDPNEPDPDANVPPYLMDLEAQAQYQKDNSKEELGDGQDGDGSSPEEKLSTARRLLKEALGVIVLDTTSTSELLGMHTELTSYLLAMDLIKPAVEFNLPTKTLAQVELCNSLIQGIDEVQDGQATRDALLELVSSAKHHIDRLNTTKRGFESTGLYCPVCLSKQYNTPSGVACEKGHGGLEGISEYQATSIRVSQAITDSKYKCAQCGSRVETAQDASHANCPKCGLVDTADIEPVEKQPLPKVDPTPTTKKGADDILSDADLAALLEPTPKATNPISPEPKEASPAKTEERQKVVFPLFEEPKASSFTQVKPVTEDPEADLVSSVIDDFLEEIQKAGGLPPSP